MNPRSASCLLLTALMGISGVAAAQVTAGTAATPSSETSKRADEIYKRGVRFYSEKKWAEAEVAFQQAWALNPTFDVAYNLGSTEYQLGKHRDAAEHLSFALRVWPLLDSIAKLRPIAEQRLRESRAAVGTLTIKVDVANAAVFVDGKLIGNAPLPGEVFVTPDVQHWIEAKAEGYSGPRRSITVQKGAAVTIELTFMGSPSTGRVRPIDPAKPGGSGEQKPPGGEGEKARVEGGPSKPLIIAGIASSAALVGAGVVFTIVASVNAAAADDQQAIIVAKGSPVCLMTSPDPACDAQKSSLAAEGTFGKLSVVSFVTGGAFGVGTAIYFLAMRKPKSQTKPPVQVVPAASANAGGVVILGRW